MVKEANMGSKNWGTEGKRGSKKWSRKEKGGPKNGCGNKNGFQIWSRKHCFNSFCMKLAQRYFNATIRVFS